MGPWLRLRTGEFEAKAKLPFALSLVPLEAGIHVEIGYCFATSNWSADSLAA